VVSLFGGRVGALTFPWQWSHAMLQDQFGGELRLFHGATAATARAVRVPVFTPAPPPGPLPVLDLTFEVTVDPRAPIDDSRTRLVLDPSTAPTAPFLRTPTGAAATIAPLPGPNGDLGAGFAFAVGLALDLYRTP